MQSLRVAALIGLVALIALPAAGAEGGSRPAGAGEGAQVARLVHLQGEVALLAAGRRFPAKAGLPLLRTDELEVGLSSWALLELENRHLVRIDEDLSIRVADLAMLGAPAAKASFEAQLEKLLSPSERQAGAERIVGYHARMSAAESVPAQAAPEAERAPAKESSRKKARRDEAPVSDDAEGGAFLESIGTVGAGPGGGGVGYGSGIGLGVRPEVARSPASPAPAPARPPATALPAPTEAPPKPALAPAPPPPPVPAPALAPPSEDEDAASEVADGVHRELEAKADRGENPRWFLRTRAGLVPQQRPLPRLARELLGDADRVRCLHAAAGSAASNKVEVMLLVRGGRVVRAALGGLVPAPACLAGLVGRPATDAGSGWVVFEVPKP